MSRPYKTQDEAIELFLKDSSARENMQKLVKHPHFRLLIDAAYATLGPIARPNHVEPLPHLMARVDAQRNGIDRFIAALLSLPYKEVAEPGGDEYVGFVKTTSQLPL